VNVVGGEMRPDFDLVSLQESLEQDAQSQDALRVRADLVQPEPVTQIERPERVVQRHVVVEQIAHGSG